MTPRERGIAVLTRWCGEDAVNDLDEKLEGLWNRTKPTGKPSHSAIDYYEPGAEDLMERLEAEFEHPPARKLNFNHTDMNPAGGSIITISQLLDAIVQSKPVSTPITTVLSAKAHQKLVDDVVARLEPMLLPSSRRAKAAGKKELTSPAKTRVATAKKGGRGRRKNP
jgi:hypothetical protein